MIKDYRALVKLIDEQQRRYNDLSTTLYNPRVSKYGEINTKTTGYYNNKSLVSSIVRLVDIDIDRRLNIAKLTTLKLEVQTGLAKYHNPTFKLITSLFILKNYSFEYISKKLKISVPKVREVVLVTLKHLFASSEYREYDYYECRCEELLCSKNLPTNIISKVKEYIDNLDAYTYDCLINCYRDLSFNVREVASIHGKSIREVKRDIEKIKADLLINVEGISYDSRCEVCT